jgi:hypothetical protein
LKNRIKENVTNQVNPTQINELQNQKDELHFSNMRLTAENSQLVTRLHKADEELKSFQQKLANIDTDYSMLEEMVSKAFAVDKNTLITKSDKNKYKLKAKTLKTKLLNANTKISQKNEKLKSAKKKIQQLMTYINQSALSPSMTSINAPPSFNDTSNIAPSSALIDGQIQNQTITHTSITPHDSPVPNLNTSSKDAPQKHRPDTANFDIDSIFNDNDNDLTSSKDNTESNKNQVINRSPKHNSNVLSQSEFHALTQSIMDDLLSDDDNEDENNEDPMPATPDSTILKRPLPVSSAYANQSQASKLARSKDPVGDRIQQMKSKALKASQSTSASSAIIAPTSNSYFNYYPRFTVETNLKRLLQKLPFTKGLTSLYVKNCEPMVKDLEAILMSILKLAKQSSIGQLKMGETIFESLDEVWVNSVYQVPLSTELEDLEYRVVISLVLFNTHFPRYNIIEYLMDQLPKHILDPVESLKQPLSYITSLCQIFISLCKITEDFTRCRVFFYDVLTLFVDCPFQLRVLSTIASTHPEVMSYSESNSPHFNMFLNVIESAIAGIFMADPNADDELYQIFIDKCNWNLLHQSPTLFESIEKLCEFQPDSTDSKESINFLIEQSLTIGRIFGSEQLKF